MSFHSILVRKLPLDTQKSQVYFIDESNVIHRSEWMENRNIDFLIAGVIFPNLIIGIDYYIDGRLMHVKKNLSNIRFVGSKIPNIPLSPIQIIFQNHKGYYMESSETLNAPISKIVAKSASPEVLQKISLLRQQVSEVQSELSNLAIKDIHMKERISFIRNIIHDQRSNASLLTRKIKSFKNFLRIKEELLIHHKLKLQSDKSNLLASISIYSLNKSNLLQIISEIHKMQMSVIRDLSFVFHIEMSSGKCYINKFPLPNSIFAKDVDYKSISIALGHTSLLVSLLSQYLFIPLRYPIVCRNSHSLLIDPITNYPPPVPENGKFVYLYNLPNNRLEWSVYLLNKNIEQVSFFRGQHVRDLRKTLPNLKLILTMSQLDSWTARDDQSSVSDRF